jgi:hypothetical protein
MLHTVPEHEQALLDGVRPCACRAVEHDDVHARALHLFVPVGADKGLDLVHKLPPDAGDAIPPQVC